MENALPPESSSSVQSAATKTRTRTEREDLAQFKAWQRGAHVQVSHFANFLMFVAELPTEKVLNQIPSFLGLWGAFSSQLSLQMLQKHLHQAARETKMSPGLGARGSWRLCLPQQGLIQLLGPPRASRALRGQFLRQFLLWGGEQGSAPGQRKFGVLSSSFSKKGAAGVGRQSWGQTRGETKPGQ